MLGREEMVRAIMDRLETATDAEVESVYWIVELEFTE